MKRMIWAALVAAAMMVPAGVSLAQPASGDKADIDSYIEMLRTDMQNARKSIADAALKLPDDKASTFWPIYRKYQLEVDAIGDKRLAVIKDYAANFEKMTDQKAGELAKQTFSNMKARTSLMEKYYKEFSKVIGPTMAARLMQVENAVNNIIDIQIASELPLITPGSVPAAADAKK
jgi:hypothetical protein